MSESYPPYGGQPDPNAPWGTPPGSPVGQPGYGQPQGYPGQPVTAPPYGAPVPPPQKSKKGLYIGLGIGAVVLVLLVACGGIIGFVALNDEDDPAPGPTTSVAAPDPTAASPSTAPQPGEPQPDNNNAVTAQSSSDMSAVCDGSPILNAAPYTSPKGAKVLTFSNSPDRPSSWRSESFGYGEPYYARSTEWEKVPVIGCLTYVEGSEGPGRKCDYKDSSQKTVTIDYVSSRYTLTFHNAKTGEKIGDGGTINAPATRCPSFIAYNRTTMKAYASPDDGALELALGKFTG
ncbi:RodZ family helix-turn-helix domain-containing protein [Micromonospora coxensis]|uniref:Uncharacterized protein n=1 Tax=Micromonospora coxensis TaxID=356852 RepID=A0A1C5J1X6_9ACTN|nr:hypothetical protein [Micromonospora coxensis]SCG64570.1 hypothetical protein GA0070614_3822 [Micromonospora coxensis]